jgi:hypothetical protein
MHNVSVIDRAGAVLEGKWSGQLPMPSLGSAVQVQVNNLGAGLVKDYVLRCGYIGLRVQLLAPSGWHLRQNDGQRFAVVFGFDLEPLTGADRAARFAWQEGDIRWLGKD